MKKKEAIMACSSIIYNLEPKEDHLMKYTEDYDTSTDSDIKSKNKDLIIEILETFHKDKSFRNMEFE